MKTKSIFVSKAFWLAIGTGVLALAQIVTATDNPLNLSPNIFAFAVTVSSVVAVIVRKLTTKPVDILPKGIDE